MGTSVNCTVHNTQEWDPVQRRWLWPYRCSRCGQCFICGHKQVGYEFWVCGDGVQKPTHPDPGVSKTPTGVLSNAVSAFDGWVPVPRIGV